jgi:hypothetical protein
MAEFSDPHQWYFVVRCEECRQFISLGEAPPIDAEAEPRLKSFTLFVRTATLIAAIDPCRLRGSCRE